MTFFIRVLLKSSYSIYMKMGVSIKKYKEINKQDATHANQFYIVLIN